MWHRERVRLDEQTTLEAEVDSDRSYRLGLWRGGECLVEFQGRGGRHRRRSHERTAAYEFRSVEQLRYEFEREIERLVDRR